MKYWYYLFVPKMEKVLFLEMRLKGGGKMEKKRIGFDLPEEVYIEVKVKCIRNHMTLTNHIIQLINADLEKNKKKSTCS